MCIGSERDAPERGPFVGCVVLSLAWCAVTLMEAVVAIVILALAAIGCLELAQGASRLEFTATEWNAAISMAESRMAQATLGAPGELNETNVSVNESDRARVRETRVTREPWRPGLELVSVSVPLSGGKQYVLRKLVRTPAAFRDGATR